MISRNQSIIIMGFIVIILTVGLSYQSSLSVKEPNLILNVASNGTLNNNIVPCNYNIIQVQSGSPRLINAYDCTNNNLLYSSTNASSVFNSIMTLVNKNKGGVVHVTGYNTTHPYNFTSPIIIPDKGHLYFYGDGVEYTVLKIPSGSDNNLFQFSGIKTSDAFFNTFKDFEGIGNPSGTNNNGFVLNGTSFGVVDSLWYNIFLRDFANDDIYMNTPNCWNNKIDDSTIELAHNAGLYITGGINCQDWKITNSKFLYNNKFGVYNDAYYGNIIEGWFYKTNQTAIKNNGGVSVIISNNRFLNNGIQTNNAYQDIWNLGTANIISNNKFAGGDAGTNLPKYAILEDTFTNGNVIVGNDFRSGSAYGTGFIFVGSTSQINNIISNNGNYNPVGKINSPFWTTGNTIIPTSGNSATPNNATDTTATNMPVTINVSGGSTVSCSIKDNNANTIISGLATLTGQYLPYGYKINCSWHTAPTFTVFFS